MRRFFFFFLWLASEGALGFEGFLLSLSVCLFVLLLCLDSFVKVDLICSFFKGGIGSLCCFRF